MYLPVDLYKLFLIEVRKIFEIEAKKRGIELKDLKLKYWEARDKADDPLMIKVRFGTSEIRHFYDRERKIRTNPKRDVFETDYVIVSTLKIIGITLPDGWDIEKLDLIGKIELADGADVMFFKFLERDHSTSIDRFLKYKSHQNAEQETEGMDEIRTTESRSAANVAASPTKISEGVNLNKLGMSENDDDLKIFKVYPRSSERGIFNKTKNSDPNSEWRELYNLLTEDFIRRTENDYDEIIIYEEVFVDKQLWVSLGNISSPAFIYYYRRQVEKTVKTYFECIKSKDLNRAILFWLTSLMMERENSVREFIEQSANCLGFSSVCIFDTIVGFDHDENYFGSCKVCYKEYYSEGIKYTLDQIPDSYFEDLKTTINNVNGIETFSASNTKIEFNIEDVKSTVGRLILDKLNNPSKNVNLEYSNLRGPKKGQVYRIYEVFLELKSVWKITEVIPIYQDDFANIPPLKYLE